MCYFHLIQRKFYSVFVTVAQVSDNITGYHLLGVCFSFFFLDVYNFTTEGIFTVSVNGFYSFMLRKCET